MSQIAVGSTLNLQFLFTDGDVLVDPATVDGVIYDISTATPTQVATFTPTNDSVGVYSYEWLANTSGEFKIDVNSTGPIVNHEMYFLIGATSPDLELGDSFVLTMLGELTPVYLDPEIILEYYSGGDIIEITEIIHRKSLELENKIGSTNLTGLTQVQYDFILTSTMCDLSRRYGFTNGGLNGFASAESFSLGDLEVSRGSSSSGGSRGKYDSGNATSWCELASVLRKELLHGEGNFRPVVPGAIYSSTIPVRTLSSPDYN